MRGGSVRLRTVVITSDLATLGLGYGLLLALLDAVLVPVAPEAAWTGLLAVVGVGVLALHAVGAYERKVVRVRRREVAVTSKAAAAPAALLALLGPRASLLVALAVAASAWGVWCALLAATRAVVGEWIRGNRARGELTAPVLVIGTGRAREMADFLGDHPHLGFTVTDAVELLPGHPDESLKLIGELTRTTQATGVVISDPGDPVIHPLLPALSRAGLHVHVATGVQGLERATAVTSQLAGELFLDFAPRPPTPLRRAVIRALDVTASSIVLALTLPVALLAAAAIKLTDGGPVFFVQERVGQYERHFPMFKFRSMRVDADEIELEDQGGNGREGPLTKRSCDPRITPVGRFLRTTSLDELPQLLNVLRGEMSLVGPRPALPVEAEQFDAELRRRTEVRPGITGLWQVEGRDLPSFQLYRRLDLLWVDNYSVTLYLSVLLRTVTALLGQTTRSVLGGDSEAMLEPERRGSDLLEFPSSESRRASGSLPNQND